MSTNYISTTGNVLHKKGHITPQLMDVHRTHQYFGTWMFIPNKCMTQWTKKMMFSTFKLLSGPFQHLSPLENSMALNESSNLSQLLHSEKGRVHNISKLIKTVKQCKCCCSKGHLVQWLQGKTYVVTINTLSPTFLELPEIA